MVIDYLDPTPTYRLQQILHTLKTIHDFELPTGCSETKIHALISENQQARDTLVENSSFNSYLSNPEYIKSMLILEALRIQLREVSPGRKSRSKTVREDVAAPDSKEQQRLAFARKLEQFAMHVIPASKTGKLSTEEKQQQEQRDLFIVALQAIADKLQHVGTAFAREQETQLSTLERDIVKLMRHAEQAGMLDDLTDKIKTRVVNKGVELYGPALLAQREELRSDPEIRRGDWEVEKEIEKEKEQPMDKKAKKSVKETDMIQSRREVTPEGNEFVKARLDAIKAGKKHFTVGGKTFQVTGDTSDELAKVDEAVLGEMHDSLEFDVEVDRDPHTDVKHYEYQASMARSELYRNAKYGMSMMNQIQVHEDIEPWIAGALTKAANYLDKIYHYLDYYKTFEPEQLPEDLDGDMDLGETSGSIARQNLMMIVEYSTKLFEMIKPGDHLEGWVAMKLTTASECISSSKHYLDYKQFETHALDDHFSGARAGKSRHIAEQALRHAKIMEQQDLAQAETLLAAKDLSNQLQQTAEKIAKMSVEDLMPLVDVMREQFGPEAAQGFNDTVKSSLESLLNATTETKDQIDTSIDTLQQGGVPGQQAEAPAPGVEPQGEESPEAELGEPSQEQPEAPEEPLGRSKKSELAEAWDDDWGSDEVTDEDGNAYEMGYRAGVNDRSSDNPFEGKDEFRAGEWEDGYKDGRKEAGLDESRQKCMECGSGSYMEDRQGKMVCNKCGHAMMAEAKEKTVKEARDDEPHTRTLVANGWKEIDSMNQIWKHPHPSIKGTIHIAPEMSASHKSTWQHSVPTKNYPVATGYNYNDLDKHLKSLGEMASKTKGTKTMEAKVVEKWDAKMKTAKKDIGKWEGFTLAELKARKKKLMDKESRSKQEQKEVSQINFAIRAKTGWGKVEESLMGMDPATRQAIASPLRKTSGSQQQQPTSGLGMKPSATGVSNPYEIASDERLRSMAAGGDKKAQQELDKRRQPVREVAPPGAKAERFIRQNKEKFRQQYGDRGEEVLYATAWKMFGKKEESYKTNQARLENVKKQVAGLQASLNEHRQTWKQQLAEGTVVDPLNTGYGLEGEIVAGKLAKAQQRQRQVETWLAAYRNRGIQKLQEQVATVREIRKLERAKKQAPWGLAYRDAQGVQQQKFFESRDNAKLWRDLNAKDIQVVQMFGPQDFDKKISKLQGTL